MGPTRNPLRSRALGLFLRRGGFQTCPLYIRYHPLTPGLDTIQKPTGIEYSLWVELKLDFAHK